MMRRTSIGSPAEVTMTVREKQVLSLVCHGRTNREIATELRIGIETVKTYVSNFLQCTGTRNRTALADWAHESGILNGNGPNGSSDA